MLWQVETDPAPAAALEDGDTDEPIGPTTPLQHPVQLPRGLTNAELDHSPPLAEYLKIDMSTICPWKEIQEDLTRTSAPGMYWLLSFLPKEWTCRAELS